MKTNKNTPNPIPMNTTEMYKDLCKRWPYNLIKDMVSNEPVDFIGNMAEIGMNVKELYQEIYALSGIKQKIIFKHYRDGISAEEICVNESITEVAYNRYLKDALAKIATHIMKNNVIAAVPKNIWESEKHFANQLLAHIAFPEVKNDLNIKAHISELPVQYIGISTRMCNALASRNVFTVYQLSMLDNDTIRMLPGSGPKTSALIIAKRDECKVLLEKLSTEEEQ